MVLMIRKMLRGTICKLDRTWELFFLSGRFTNERVRFMSSVALRLFYYLVILASAFLLTRNDLSHN